MNRRRQAENGVSGIGGRLPLSVKRTRSSTGEIPVGGGSMGGSILPVDVPENRFDLRYESFPDGGEVPTVLNGIVS